MREPISSHVRANLVAYVALFFALSGGAAWATHPGGQNTISSADIINKEVGNADLAPNSIGSGKIMDGEVKNPDYNPGSVKSNTIGDGQVKDVDLGDLAVSEPKLADGAVTMPKLADGAVTEEKSSGLVAHSKVFWAVVEGDGTLSRASHDDTVATQIGTGDYTVKFDGTDLDPCASVAQISRSSFFSPAPGPGEAASKPGTADGDRIDVRTFDSDGTLDDLPFTVHVLCPEAVGGVGPPPGRG